jgi:hypothetical protein
MDEGRYGRPEADEFERSRLLTVTELSAALQGRGGAEPTPGATSATSSSV